MTPEAQRIAIAEACGWTLRRSTHKEFTNYDPPLGNKDFTLYPDGSPAFIPDYLNDLNAIAIAELTIPKEKRVVYSQWLEIACDKTVKPLWLAIAMCTASQRAEAFLKTLNLWQDK
jgi:hypothetical protein